MKTLSYFEIKTKPNQIAIAIKPSGYRDVNDTCVIQYFEVWTQLIGTNT